MVESIFRKYVLVMFVKWLQAESIRNQLGNRVAINIEQEGCGNAQQKAAKAWCMFWERWIFSCYSQEKAHFCFAAHGGKGIWHCFNSVYVCFSGSGTFTTSLIPPSFLSSGAFSLQDHRWLGISGSSSWASVTNSFPTLGSPARSKSSTIRWSLSDTSDRELWLSPLASNKD